MTDTFPAFAQYEFTMTVVGDREQTEAAIAAMDKTVKRLRARFPSLHFGTLTEDMTNAR